MLSYCELVNSADIFPRDVVMETLTCSVKAAYYSTIYRRYIKLRSLCWRYMIPVPPHCWSFLIRVLRYLSFPINLPDINTKLFSLWKKSTVWRRLEKDLSRNFDWHSTTVLCSRRFHPSIAVRRTNYHLLSFRTYGTVKPSRQEHIRTSKVGKAL